MRGHRRRSVGSLMIASIAALVLPASAQAHVTLQPSELPADQFVRADVRVPNERDDASTNKVAVRFPSGFLFASYEPVPGWKGKITTEKLAKPVPSPEEGEPPIKERVKQATFTATGAGIGPGQFQDFGLSLLMPNKPGTTLTFKAIQTYSNGEITRWIGPPDSEEAAPQVKLTSASETPATPAAGTSEDDGDDEDDDDASRGLVIAALIVGGLGLLAGGAALAASRRRRT
jgi:uncharacterized protein YcnI